MKVIGYIRVSTEGQVVDGASMEAQRRRIHQWAELNEGEVEHIYEDAGISGKTMRERPALLAALEATTKGKALVVYSLSRLARSTRDMLSIADQLAIRKADLVSISERFDTTTAAGKLMFRMLAVLAEFERDIISERTKAALAVRKSQGVKLGSPNPHAGGAVIGARASAAAKERHGPLLVAAGDGSLAVRAARLNAAGYRTVRGKPFTTVALWRMLKRAQA
jgi:DNA invertase Pin-like site-specific DNA recombinase